jgi:hypothetical protein
LAPIATALAPTDPTVNTNLQLWLLANGTNVTTTGSTVTGWNDQSGLGHNATALNVTSSPPSLQTVITPMALVAATNNGQSFSVVNTGAVLPGTDVINSVYGGAGAFNIPSSSGLSLASGVGSTYFVVLETGVNTDPGFARILGTDLMGNGSYRNVSQGGATLQTYDGSDVRVGTTPVNTGEYVVAAIRFNNTSLGSNNDTALFVNGGKQDFSPAVLSAVNAFNIGYNPAAASPSNPYFQGNIAQLLVYNSPLSDDQVLGISQAIGQADGIFASVPEPSTLLLAAIGLGLALAFKRRQSR